MSGRRLVILMATAAALAVGAGCGSDDEDSGNGGDGGAAARDIQPESQQRAESLLLEISDFPDGWRASPADEEDDAGVGDCLDADFSQLTLNGEADSDDFATGDVKEASSSASIFVNDQDAEQAVANLAELLGTTRAEDCIADGITKAIEDDAASQGAEVGEIDVGELSFTPPDVEEGRAWEVAIPIEVGAFSETLSVQLVVLREGGAIATLDAVQLSERERDDLLDVLADRLTAPAT